MDKIIIAVDGYSGCGKSTLAQQLAEKLQYLYIDTGAMYRAITLFFIRHKAEVPEEHNKACLDLLKDVHLTFERNEQTGKNEMMLNGKNVEEEIRGMEVANRVSEIAAIPEVRTHAVRMQQKLGESKGVVLDGRDIGTVVFPDAELKIFLTASMEVRVERRWKELQKSTPYISREEVKKNLKERDYKDTHRRESPLRQAEDAVLIDNSCLSKEEQLQKALQLASAAIS